MSHSILIIEDEANLRTEIADMLGFEGYLVFTASDGEEGVKEAHAVHPDLIVCDINMPKMDGYEVLEVLRSDESFVNTPFLFLTAKSAHEDMRAGMKLGADDYLTKPFSITELIEAVEARIARIQAVAAVRDQSVEDAKETFMKMIVHELRTPVSAMHFSTDMLMESLGEVPPEDLKQLASITKVNSQRLNLLVERVILFVRSEMGELDIDRLHKVAQPYDLVNILSTAEEQAATIVPNAPHPLVPTKHIRDPDIQVKGVTPYLQYALAELIANAVKFSEKGNPVNLQQWSNDEFVYVGLTNRGTPITREEFEQARQPFTQIDRKKHEQQGVGLGLTLAEGILRGLGGGLTLFTDEESVTHTVITLVRSNE